MKEFEISVKPGTVPDGGMIRKSAASVLGVPEQMVGECEVLRRSIDARKGSVCIRYRIRAFVSGEVNDMKYTLPEYMDVSSSEPVIIIGGGPAGMFAALRLLQEGMKPVILERGKDVHSRKFDVAAISKEGRVDPDSNYCFGEGGAGTFSDGKLYTRSNKRGDIREVLYQLVKFGADPSILIDAHPHIGSDRLPSIVENIRLEICRCGGEYHFSSRVVSLERDHGRWVAETSSGSSFSAKNVILATGHSARDVYEMFRSRNWALEPKGFAIGVRAEHPQSLIDMIQYRGKYRNILPAAEYSLVAQIDGGGVFSFCMCPGGILVPSSTSDGETVLNGMSNSMRNSRWANSGIVVTVNPGDVPEYDKYGVFSLLEFQKKVERDAFSAVSGSRNVLSRPGSRFAAPSQRMTDFVNGRCSSSLPATSYSPGAVSLPLHEILPRTVSSRLRKAFREFDKKMKGYYTEEALLLGVESRTSSPVRIPRNPDTLEHVNLQGIYPCGEGAGYSGGIVSSAIDGIRAAAAIKNNLQRR